MDLFCTPSKYFIGPIGGLDHRRLPLIRLLNDECTHLKLPILNPYTIFVRWMIHPQAADLSIGTEGIGIGFPVDWAVRGFLPEELSRRHLTNSMNMLPVFRSDSKELDVLSPRGVN